MLDLLRRHGGRRPKQGHLWGHFRAQWNEVDDGRRLACTTLARLVQIDVLCALAQRVTELALHLRSVSAQHRVGRQIHPARLWQSARDRAHEATYDLSEDHRGLRRRRVHANTQPWDVNSLGDHVHGHDPRLA